MLGLAAAAVFVAGASAQSPGVPPSEKNHFIGTPKGWVHPMTPWGEPSLEGTWPIPAGINLERCAGGGGRGRGNAPPCDPSKAWLTEEEFQARVRQLSQPDRATQALAAGDLGGALQSGVTDPLTPVRQTSLIVDPPNGRLPALTAEGKRRSALMKSSWALYPGEPQVWDHWTDFDSWDRCITRGMPTSMMAYRYNNGLKIFQAPGMVVISHEMIHEDRVIYTDGRPPLPPVHKHYLGVPRGRWEGNTLVVTTTNYKEGPSGTNIGVYGSPPGNRWPVSDQMKTVERFTRLNDDYILYEMTIEDPVVMERPYTIQYPLKRDDSYQWWEYNCHEGNRTIVDYISASRAERAAKAAGAGSDPGGSQRQPEGR
ncbi:MAG TPA: hypothetical protein VNI78_07785 [Vicinamibacterales bacterium]|nr:hypothetical protein [Vicinamibacterales bacterium]